MSRLAGLQEGFQAYLLDEEGGAGFRASIVDDDRVGAERRLRIYHDAYRLRLVEALGQAYPNLAKLLGQDLFERLARSFIAAHPSEFRNLRWYGGELPGHLARELPEHPIAAELATFEWALAAAFDAPDVATLSLADLAGLPAEQWGGLRFGLHPSVRILPLALNTVPVWKALDEEHAPPAVEHAPATWLIWRKGLDPHFRSLDDDEARLLELARQGAAFADLCEAVDPEQAQAELAAQYLDTWLADGLIARS